MRRVGRKKLGRLGDHQSDSQVRMRAVQGAICIASIVQLVIGYTGDCIILLDVHVIELWHQAFLGWSSSTSPPSLLRLLLQWLASGELRRFCRDSFCFIWMQSWIHFMHFSASSTLLPWTLLSTGEFQWREWSFINFKRWSHKWLSMQCQLHSPATLDCPWSQF